MKRKQYGSYVLFLKEPESEEEKKEYVKKAFAELLDQLTRTAVPDWNTLSVIVKEGVDFLPTTDWYEDEEEDYAPSPPQWHMTVALKYESENYEQEEQP